MWHTVKQPNIRAIGRKVREVEITRCKHNGVCGENSQQMFDSNAETTPMKPTHNFQIHPHPFLLTPVLYYRKLVSNHRHVITCRINLPPPPVPAEEYSQKEILDFGFPNTRLLHRNYIHR